MTSSLWVALLLGASAQSTGTVSPTSDVSGQRVKATGATQSRTLADRFADVLNVKDFGARGDGKADDTAAIQAALNAAATSGSGVKTVFAPAGNYRVPSGIVIPERGYLLGAGANTTTFTCAGAVTCIAMGTSDSIYTYKRILENVTIAGSGTTALHLQGSLLSTVSRVTVSGTWTDGFVFDTTWGSAFSDLSTSGATISNRCFVAGKVFNANRADNWYTSNFSAVNIAVDGTGGASLPHGNHFSMLTAQGGDIGLLVAFHSDSTFTGLYTENIGRSIVMGKPDGTAIATTISFVGGSLGPIYASHRLYGKQETMVDLVSVAGISFSGVRFDGAFNAGAFAPVVISGDGTGAEGVARVTPGGAVHSLELLGFGSGYTFATVAFGGVGTGATATATVAAGEVTALNLTAGGSGYSPGPYFPTAIRYKSAFRVTVSGFYHSAQGSSGLTHPLYPWIVRSAGADPAAGVMVIGDSTSQISGFGNTANLAKARGWGYQHFLTETASDGSDRVTQYIPPEYATTLLAGSSSHGVVRRRLGGSLSWKAPLVAAGASVSTTLTVTGATVGNAVVVGSDWAAMPAGLILGARVTAPQTVTISITNVTAGAVTPARATYTVSIFGQ